MCKPFLDRTQSNAGIRKFSIFCPYRFSSADKWNEENLFMPMNNKLCETRALMLYLLVGQMLERSDCPTPTFVGAGWFHGVKIPKFSLLWEVQHLLSVQGKGFLTITPAEDALNLLRRHNLKIRIEGGKVLRLVKLTEKWGADLIEKTLTVLLETYHPGWSLWFSTRENREKQKCK